MGKTYTINIILREKNTKNIHESVDLYDVIHGKRIYNKIIRMWRHSKVVNLKPWKIALDSDNILSVHMKAEANF